MDSSLKLVFKHKQASLYTMFFGIPLPTPHLLSCIAASHLLLYKYSKGVYVSRFRICLSSALTGYKKRCIDLVMPYREKCVSQLLSFCYRYSLVFDWFVQKVIGHYSRIHPCIVETVWTCLSRKKVLAYDNERTNCSQINRFLHFTFFLQIYRFLGEAKWIRSFMAEGQNRFAKCEKRFAISDCEPLISHPAIWAWGSL